MRKTTNDEQEIRLWASRRNAHPIELTQFTHDTEPAMLGFVFGHPAVDEGLLRPISWSQFFAMFHLMGLVLAHDGGDDYALLKVEDKPSEQFAGKPMQA
ncbi:MAG: hypothetical protein ACRYFU_14460 [Janthinobacterium lividum]